jgi:phage/plasmid-like protein (TIGR03299 family)
MAHMLNFNKRTGTWSFASNSEVAWHGLGQVVKGAMTAEEAIKNANLDYEVDKAKVQFFPATDKQIWVEGHYATYRKDTYDYLGMVKSRYEIVQNRDAFGFFDAIIDEGEAIFETAGALGNGERIFLVAKLPSDFEIGGEKIEKYIMLTNSHDGSSSVIAGMTNIRVVCNNTLQAALKGLENKVSINHISGAKDKLKEAHRVMGIASNYSNQVQDIFNQMADRKMTEGQYRDYFEAIFTPEYKTAMTAAEEKEMSTRLKNMIEGTTQFAFTHPTQTTDAANGTLWGAYNAVSGYYNYIKTFKSTEDKFNSQFFGVANKKMLKSFNQAVALIND